MTLTLDEAPTVPFHRKLSALASGGAFLSGYINSITGVALIQITPQLDLTAWQVGIVGMSALVGALPGSFLGGWLADRYGRRPVYMIDLVAILLCAVGGFWATTFIWLVVSRLLIGVAIGADQPIATSMMVEWLPRRSRGRLLGAFVVWWFTGASIAYAVGYLLLFTGEDGWRWMALSAAVPTLVIIVLRIGTPESPRWLAREGRLSEAQAIIKKIWGQDLIIDDANSESAQLAERVPLRELLQPGYLGRIVFATTFWALSGLPQQAIYMYGPSMLKELHLEGELSVIASGVITAVFLLGSVVAVGIVNKMGRRTLAIHSFAWGAVALLILGLFPESSALIIMLLFGLYAMVIGGTQILQAIWPVEMFPTEIRAVASGITFTGVNVITVIVILLVPVGIESLGVGWVLILGALSSVLGALVCLLWGPETRHLSLAAASSIPAESPVMPIEKKLRPEILHE
ncbi:MFS transporter [Rhodococcus koreensis]